jgi:hypothetical protein
MIDWRSYHWSRLLGRRGFYVAVVKKLGRKRAGQRLNVAGLSAKGVCHLGSRYLFNDPRADESTSNRTYLVRVGHCLVPNRQQFLAFLSGDFIHGHFKVATPHFFLIRTVIIVVDTTLIKHDLVV